jgi:CRISPR-associated protein Cas4
VRDQIAERLTQALPGRAAEIERFAIGRGATDADKARRIRILPLLSIGTEYTDPAIRRVLIEIPPDCPIAVDDVLWSVSGLGISDGIDRGTGEILAEGPVLVPAEATRMLEHYGIGAAPSKRWQTVTPAALSERKPAGRIGGEARAAAERRAAPARAEHLFFFADDGNRDGYLDRVAIIAPRLADRRVTADHRRHLRQLGSAIAGMVVLRAGSAGAPRLVSIAATDETDPVFGRAKHWVSRTRYRPTRHPRDRRNEDEALRRDLLLECERRGLPRPDVKVISVASGPRGGISGHLHLAFSVAIAGPLLRCGLAFRVWAVRRGTGLPSIASTAIDLQPELPLPPPLRPDQPYVPARMVNEFQYCPRLAYLEWVQGEWAESADTVEGRGVHRRVDGTAGKLPEAEAIGDDERIHARSITLSSDRLGLIAKLDLVEVEDGAVVPVDYKRGKRPHVAAGAYEPELVQLCVQGLILEDNGYRCSEGVLYFRASRERIRVLFDPELRTKALAAVSGLRLVAMGGRVPPPLEDSPKCPRCSLVAICMPEEVNFLRHGIAPRPLAASH